MPEPALDSRFHGNDGEVGWCYVPAMKAAFTLFLIALMILPAIATVRIMLSRERRRQRDEEERGG